MKKTLFYTFLIFAAVFFLAQYASAASNPNSKGFVTPDWLKKHTGDQNLVIVDVSLTPEDYQTEHIPDAVYINWKSELSDPMEKRYYKVLPKEGFERVMNKIGATPDSTLIFYDNLNNRIAIRAHWVASYYGHEKAMVLEGGIAAWKYADFETSKEVPTSRATNYIVGNGNSEINVDKQWVKLNLRNMDVLFVDSRPYKMYTGEITGKMIHTGLDVVRRGHLPGAVSIPWKVNINDRDMFLDESALMQVYSNQGLGKYKTVVFYCNEGVHAAYNWFITTKILGFRNVKIYEGSMGEWADEALLPLVSGIGF
jgi:thiosulfate/3-mercaptopyruvate sulfurtransferase